MTKPDILKALGWDEKLIAAFETGEPETPEFAEVDLDLEPVQTSATEVSLRIENPILLTQRMASAR